MSYPNERREIVRVAVEIGSIFRRLENKSSKGISGKGGIFCKVPEIPSFDIAEKLHIKKDQSYKEFTEMLIWLDWKISFLTKRVNEAREMEIFPHHAMLTELSGEGAKLMTVTKQGFQRGDLLELNFVLPILPFKEMLAQGKIIHFRCVSPEASDADQQYEIGLHFFSVTTTERDHIFRYGMKRQMEIQRGRQSDPLA